MAKKFVVNDGNYAASNIAYLFSEVAAIYPITPSSNMAENVDEWAANGRKNMFGEPVRVVEMQSEAGAAGAVHGSLQAGALTTTYTASQGLLLMIPNMYKMAGELLPAVFHVSARTVAAHALSIFGDHSDIYATRQTGFALLASGSVQQASDLAAVAHLAAIKSRIPFLHFFDGFRTSHEIQKYELLDETELKNLVDKNALKKFRENALSPEHPVTRGTAQNPDIFFQAKEVAQPFYDAVPEIVAEYMKQISKLSGRDYKPFNYYGHPEAENIIIAMGSVTDTIKEVVDFLISKGQKVGLVCVHLYRPFSPKYMFEIMPKTVKRIVVLDRTKEPGANGEPLYLDVVEAIYKSQFKPEVLISGRYGLSSKDTTPAQIIAVFDNLAKKEPKDRFTIGIIDDVNFSNLPPIEEIDLSTKGTFQGKFYGLGSDGTVGANKNSIKIIGDNTDKYSQAYFAYDSKKSGGVTVSHLRFGDSPIRSPYLITTPDFVACSAASYLDKYDMLKGIKQGGTFLLNSIWNANEIEKHLPNKIKKTLAEKNVNFYIINATDIAKEIGLGNRTNTILQSAFFKISGVIPYEIAVKDMKYAIEKTYGKKGEDIVKMNYAAIDKGGEVVKIEVKPEWKNLQVENKQESNRPEFIRKIVDVINALNGDDIPVSTFKGYEDGTFISGTSAFEKRSIAVDVPEWQSESCTQCNTCAYSCPHAAIRPFLMTEEELAKAPAGTIAVPAKNKELAGYKFRIQVSIEDCTGCGVCAEMCPTKSKSLLMKSIESQEAEKERWYYMHEKVGYKKGFDTKSNILMSQFAQPLFEFSGACAGCGETPYVKLITQLFGDHMTIANATGCSSIYGASAPSTPYTMNAEGKGPAWANSLFEDNAEFGLGIAVGIERLRHRIADRMKVIISGNYNQDLKAAAQEWLDGMHSNEKSAIATNKLLPLLQKTNDELAKELLELKDYFTKKSHWIFGGDGWAYDIGYGGLDHVLASGENVNVLVLDTEVYSNTGGQASKSSPTGAVAKFAAAGKQTRKKDLGLMAATYGYVYVAQVSLGANPAHFFKVLKEAEAYNGPSLIIAYSPCIAHGMKDGMSFSQRHQKDAVKCGFWNLWTYNPDLEKEGKNPFNLVSKDPDWSAFRSYLLSETRFNSLLKTFPERAEELYQAAEANAKWKFEYLKRLSSLDYSQK